MTRHERTGILTYSSIWAVSLLMLVPFVWLVCGALKTNEDFLTSTFIPWSKDGPWPDFSRLTLDNFRKLFREVPILRALLNSIFLSSVTAILATLMCAMGGYALAKLDFKGRRAMSWLVLAAVIIPPTLLLAPSYQLLFQLGLLDTFTGLILPAAVPAFGVHLFRESAAASVPDQIIEAARIDGSGELRIFFTLALPLMRPMAGTFLLITFLGVWNNFISPQIVLQSEGRLPLAVAVAQLKGVYYQDYGLQMAGTLISVAPVLVLFLLLQREFISGLTTGAVKG